MQQSKKSSGLDLWMSHFTRELRQAMRLGIESGLAQALRAVPAPPARAALCQVPGCKRAVAARSLCQTHYSKARRIGFNEDRLNSEQLRTLGHDGRKARFSGQAR